MPGNDARTYATRRSRFLALGVEIGLFPMMLLCMDDRTAGSSSPQPLPHAESASRPLVSPQVHDDPARPGSRATLRPGVSHDEKPRSDWSLRTGAPAHAAARAHATLGRLRAYTEEEVIALIERHARSVGLDPAVPLAIAKCESRFKWNVKNRMSTAAGVFQYLAGTWAQTSAGRAGLSPLDADANVRMALAHIARHGTAPWNASRECWIAEANRADAAT